MKRLLAEVVTERQFLRLYFDKSITHLTIGRPLIDKELQDVHQGLNISKSITHFTYRTPQGQSDHSQRNTIIQSGLKSNTTVQHLDLHEESALNQPGPVPPMLAINHSLIYLDMANNNIGPAAGKLVGEGLKGNKVLTYLNLRGNNLQAQGIEVIALSLQYNDTLEYLDLSQNSLMSQGARHLGPALEGI